MELDKAVKGVLSVRKRIETSWDNPSALSDLGNRMATYLAYLGDHIGELEEVRENSKASIYLDYVNKGESATSADNMSRAEVAEQTGQLKKLRLMHSDAHAQVSMIQSRLRVLESERRSEI